MNTQATLKSIINGVTELAEEVVRLEKINANEVAPAMKVVNCNDFAYVNVRTNDLFWRDAVAFSMKNVEASYEKIENAHAANADAITHNKNVIAKLTEIMQAAGVPSTVYVKNGKGMVGQSAGFVLDLAKTFTTNDNYEIAKRRVADVERRIKDYTRDQIQKEAQAKLAESNRQSHSAKEFEIRKIAEKYGLPADARFDAYAVFEHLLSRDEFLEDWHTDDVNGEHWDEDIDHSLTGMVDDALIDDYWKIRTFLNI